MIVYHLRPSSQVPRLLADGLRRAEGRHYMFTRWQDAALLLSGLYAKNYALFGVFGATSWGGANVTLATTHRMPAQLKREWIAEGHVSPFAGISVFAGPQEYLRFLPADLHFPWPGSNELTRPSVGAPNYNHGLFLQVNRQRAQDAAYFIRNAPLQYVRNVFAKNLPALFGSTTHWHARDKLARQPQPHRHHVHVCAPGLDHDLRPGAAHGHHPRARVRLLIDLRSIRETDRQALRRQRGLPGHEHAAVLGAAHREGQRSAREQHLFHGKQP